VAAGDGTSRWITGPEARQWAQRNLRSQVDAIAVGRATYAADSPQLTVRGVAVVRQPLRVVLGSGQAEGFVSIEGRDPVAACAQLYDVGVRHLLLEGGPTVGASFLRAGLVDELVWFAAPMLLGAGTPAIAELGITTLADADRWRVLQTEQLGDDILIRCRRR
jgi:diaminohydroxyphosphoribosylaminopyrimidine deaminase/5-amino-6-(5-phosphoribosylamino)uracil reductase